MISSQPGRYKTRSTALRYQAPRDLHVEHGQNTFPGDRHEDGIPADTDRTGYDHQAVSANSARGISGPQAGIDGFSLVVTLAKSPCQDFGQLVYTAPLT